MTEQSRPLDALNKSRGKRVIVELKNNKQFIGKLNAFDIHINLVVDNTKEFINNEMKRSLGLAFIRGNTILWVSPAPAEKR